MFEIARLMLAHHMGITTILKLIFYTIPYSLSIIIPTVALMSPLLTALRLSHDKEYIALKAAGIGPFKVFPPIVFFGFICMIFTLFVTSLGIPLGSGAARDLIFQAVQRDAELVIEPGVFYDRFPRFIIYIDNIERDGMLKGIFLYDNQNQKSIMAQSGYISKNKETFVFNLKRGHIWQDRKDNQSGILGFETYNFSFTFPQQMGKRRKKPKEYTPWQLWEKIKKNEENRTALILALNRKLSLPVASFIFSILGVCLGLISFKKVPSGGITLGIIFFILYQVCFSAAISLAETHILPPKVGLWLPDIGLFIITAYFLWRLAHE